MKFSEKFSFLSLSILLLIVEVYSLDDDKLFKIHLNSVKDAKLIHEFRLNHSNVVDLWQEPRENSSILAQLKNDTFKEFLKLGLHFNIAKDNLNRLFEESIRQQKRKELSRKRIYLSSGKNGLDAENFDLNEYHSYDEIGDYLRSVATKTSSSLGVNFFSIGETYEKRQIYALTIGKEALVEKKILLFECGIHAREWISPAACLKIIDRLLFNKDSLAQEILNRYDVHIIPVLNPDGYEYTRNHDRAWRKNRSKNFPMVDICKGTDLNRNFDVEFGTVGVDARNPCSLIYCGRRAFSEKESTALKNYIAKIQNSIHMYISLHSFSQLLLYPYGAYKDVPKNNVELKKLASLAQDAILSKQGERYQAGNIFTAIYPASGSTIDWVELHSSSKYNFCFEMRDTGEYGFVLPEELIDPAFMDVWIGIEQLVLNMEH